MALVIAGVVEGAMAIRFLLLRAPRKVRALRDASQDQSRQGRRSPLTLQQLRHDGAPVDRGPVTPMLSKTPRALQDEDHHVHF